jgi:hypothetical protein
MPLPNHRLFIIVRQAVPKSYIAEISTAILSFVRLKRVLATPAFFIECQKNQSFRLALSEDKRCMSAAQDAQPDTRKFSHNE